MRSSINNSFSHLKYRFFTSVMKSSSTIVFSGLLIICSYCQNIYCVPYQPSSSELDMSFKRLESGENSGEITNQCCFRESKFATIGYGLDSEELRVDVGYCRQSCETAKIKPLKREEFDQFLKKYPDMDPIQIFLSLQHRQQQQPSHNNEHNNNLNGNGDQPLFPINPDVNETGKIFKFTSKSSTSSCVSSKCQPTLLRREKHFLLSGMQMNVDVVETCDCVVPLQQCQRTPLQVKIHPGTPFERVVDVGQCTGPCPAYAATPGAEHQHHHHQNGNNGYSTSCKPIRNQSITIDGPNGQECVNIIQECHCVGECYRTKEFLKVYDYTLTTDESDSPTNSSSSSDGSEESLQLLKEPIIKMIDIGRCEGTCLKTQVTSKCLLWSNTNSTCLSSLYGGQNQCTPTKFMTHWYTDKLGHRHNIFSVLSCGCR